MLDIKFIRENPEKVKKSLAKRGVKTDLDSLLQVEEKYRTALQAVEELRAQQNVLSKKFDKRLATAVSADEVFKMKVAEGVRLKEDLKSKEALFKELEGHFHSLMRQLPNIPQEEVPGGDENYNVVLRHVGKMPKFSFPQKDHLELGEALGVLDVERAAKVSGSRFVYLRGDAVLLEFALVRLVMEYAAKEKFIPVIPPVLVKAEMMEKMGYVDTPEDLAERYFFEKENMFLVGTSEQSVGPIHENEVLQEKDLPLRYVAFSTCFREEAGSYGRDTKGILRVHQFDKVEFFSLCRPEGSSKEHKFLVALEEKLWKALGIPYRVVQLAAGDMSRPSSSTLDIEAWLPGQEQYREVSSASNTTDFQARRMNIRYRTKEGKTEFVHMLNATGLAIGRTLIAILENYQQKDGSVEIPKVLQEYVGKKEIKKPV